MLEYNENNNFKKIILDILSNLVVNMIVLVMANKVFKDINISSINYVFIVALLLIVFNKFIKPLIKVLMLTLNIYTLGLSYPFVNVIVLKLISIILKPDFVFSGWFSAFFISIFISIMTFIIDRIIGKVIREV